MTRFIRTHLVCVRLSLPVFAVTLLGLTGCSATTTSHIIEPEPAVSPYAVASLEPGFYEQPFSLVAADTVGLAAFGSEIAEWGEMPRDAELTVHLKQAPKPKRSAL